MEEKLGEGPGVDKKSMLGGDMKEEVQENYSRERRQYNSGGWRGEQRPCMSEEFGLYLGR